MRKKAITFTLAIFVIAMVLLGLKAIDRDGLLNKPLVNDNYNYISINQILMYISNNGDGSHDPATDGNGFYWPGGINAQKAAIFEDGLIWGTKIGRETRVNGNTHRQGLQAGKILPGGIPDDPSLSRYRVFKVRKGWENLPPGSVKDEYEVDYTEWPVEDGAPWVDEDGDGIYTPGVDHPEYIGDEVLWYVANDMDEARATGTYGTTSIGLEFQTTTFGFNRTGDLGDILFKKYLIINKGFNTCNEMVLGYWSDTDLGDANDDFTGCDTLLSLGYTYNGDNEDGDGAGITYGVAPPAVGYDFFQGPIVPSPGDSAKFFGGYRQGFRNLGLTAFTLYINGNATYSDPDQGVAQGSVQFYRYLTGFIWNGNPFIDPHTNEVVKFVVPGDPVAGVGWYEGPGWPGGEDPEDRRHLMASGPITLAPGDSQEVVIGFIIAQGTDNLNSITELKRKDNAAQIAYNLDFSLTPPPVPPAARVVEKDRTIALYWEDNSEDYDAIDPLLIGKDFDEEGNPITDTTYTFEGYRIWQYRDLAGTDPILLGVYDVVNGISTIYGIEVINGENVVVPVIKSPDEGTRYFEVTATDAYSNSRLRNGSPYYFSVTAYGYSEFSAPQYLESTPQIFEVFPGTRKIDETFPYDSGDDIVAEHIAGVGNGYVGLRVVDPMALTGDEYRVSFTGEGEDLTYTFVNYTTMDTILADCTNMTIDTVQAPVIDGFLLLIENTGQENIDASPVPKNYLVRNVLETNGPGGVELTPPVDVFGQTNSTGSWEITSYGIESDPLQNININDQIGFQSYEIRFTSTGSEYYLTGSNFGFQPWRTDDPKADGRVPFEIWDVGLSDSEDDDSRVWIRTMDDYASLQADSNWVDQNGEWSQLQSGDNEGAWEPIYAFIQDSSYSEPIEATSGRIPPGQEQRSRIGRFIIDGDQPAEGTVIRVDSWRPLTGADEFSVVADQPNLENFAVASETTDEISVFPNPYFGANPLERDKYQRFMRFTNLPSRVTIRIFTLAGVYIQRLEKDDDTQWLDWDLRNRDGLPVASGVYIAHLEMPDVGEKILKLAVIMETQYIDRL
jgi:hypothetical protein